MIRNYFIFCNSVLSYLCIGFPGGEEFLKIL